MATRFVHEPVLLSEALEHWRTDPSGLYLDATFGFGGHTRRLLERLNPEGKVLGIDLDPEVLRLGLGNIAPQERRLTLQQGNFRNIGSILEAHRFHPLAGALFDLGVCSYHLEQPSRGFSFQASGPLDMRLDPGNPLTAETIVNQWPIEQLTLLLREYGEERAALRIARAIVLERSRKPIQTTDALKSLIERVLPRSDLRIHPATRTFMALRISVNQELENLSAGLQKLPPYLKKGGRIVAISFHSLDDRIVKNAFKTFVEKGWCRWIVQSPTRPTAKEVGLNPRARSAKLRVVEKIMEG